jgi:hypothetical protein
MKLEFQNEQMEQMPIENLREEQFLNLAIETSKQLGWIFGDINKTGFVAYTNNGIFSWNAEIKMKIMNGQATLKSQSRGNNLVDLIGNKKNIENFILTFKSLKKNHQQARPNQNIKILKQ